MQQQLSIIVGVLMILVALIPEKVFAKYNFSKPVYRLITKVKSSLGQQFKNKSYKSLFTIGLLNGFYLAEWFTLHFLEPLQCKVFH